MTRRRIDSDRLIARLAIISGGLTAFMFIVRPFGLSIDTLPELLVVLGFAPLNFAIMLLFHSLSFAANWVNAVWRTVAIVGTNILYISILSGERTDIAMSIKVIIITLLVFAAASLWSRERNLHREVMELRELPVFPSDAVLVLRGESDRDILRIRPDALRYVKADGNYVSVQFLSGEVPTERLLRMTLKGVMATVPKGLLVQCHRSYFINLGNAQRIFIRRDRMEVEFGENERVPVSRAYRDVIRNAAKK